MTVNPYMGAETIAPYVDSGRGVFVLVRTSNPGAADFEDRELAGGGRLWEEVARTVDALGVGAVVGATAPEHLARARELMPRATFLLPGVGAQGGRVEDLAAAFAPGRAGGLVTASRSIARAHESAGGGPRPSGCASRHGRCDAPPILRPLCRTAAARPAGSGPSRSWPPSWRSSRS